jgi:hypothetical protein
MFTTSKQLPNPAISVASHPENNIVFNTGTSEMLRVTKNAFYVRGKEVPADEKEAEAVYTAFKAFLVHHALTRN